MSSAGPVRITRAVVPLLIPAMAYGIYKANLTPVLKQFLTGPGKYSRLFALLMLLFNWKSLPFAWTVRVLGGMIQHFLVRKHHTLTPDKLFHPAISTTHTALMEVDYNIHKSNSTYFADLDVSRTHLVAHLFARGCHAVAHNAETRLVMDPTDPSKPARGKFGVMLGSVSCNFRREIKPFAKFDMFSQVLAWDRKWMYIVTYFVEAGAVKPRSWDDPALASGKTRSATGLPEGFEKKIYASSISKYVFKVGRLTVHPAVLIGASGLLPERPGGWVSVDNSGADTPESDTAVASASVTPAEEAAEVVDSGEWDWRRTEAQLQRGLRYAKQFAALEGLHSEFDGGENGALGHFSMG